MADPENRLITNIFTLKELVSIPIQAVIEADYFAAKSAIRLIEAEGFEHGHLRMVSFTYTFVDGGQPKSITVRIPYLSLIPLPLLEIKHADFRISLKILDQYRLEKPGLSDNGVSGTDDPPRQVFAVLADQPRRATSEQRSGGFAANMDMEIRVGRADLPAGLLQLMNLGQEGTRGTSNPMLKLGLSTPKLHFSPQNKRLPLEVFLATEDDRDVLVDGEVSVGITLVTKSPSKLFATPPNVIVGDPVGTASYSRTRAFTSAGRVVFEFNVKAFDGDNNGLIKVSCAGAESQEVYFRIIGEE